MKNSISSRIKITKTGKMMRRPMGVRHFQAKKGGQAKQYSRKNLRVSAPDARMFKKYGLG